LGAGRVENLGLGNQGTELQKNHCGRGNRPKAAKRATELRKKVKNAQISKRIPGKPRIRYGGKKEGNPAVDKLGTVARLWIENKRMMKK